MSMRVTCVVLLAFLAGSAGCIENMGELKAALGATEAPALLASPDYLPPLARAQANVTTVLTGAPVRFTSEGTRDPQALPLDFVWSFGDGTGGQGASVQHAFASAGEYAVRLTVSNAVGLTDVATLTLQVGAAGRSPVACIQPAPERGDVGTALSFDASCSSDPEGQTLSYAWDFGDGATSLDVKPTHAFAAPGLHTVKVKVSDPTGLSAETTRVVPVDFKDERTGSFEALDDVPKSHVFPVAAGARTLEVTLTFPGGLGGNDLVLLLKDAAGDEVDRTAETTVPGAQDVQVRILSLARDDLAKHPAGSWTAEITRGKGLMVDYTVDIRETF